MKPSHLLLFAVVAVAPLAAGAAAPSTIDGWISDSSCGATHAGSGAACVKRCVEGGAKPVFVDQKKKAVWAIDNPETVKNFLGDHVVITATADSEAKSVHIESIQAAK